MKRIITFFLIIILFGLMLLPINAAGTDLIRDDAQLLTQSQLDSLKNQAYSLDFPAAILTKESLDGEDIELYAQRYMESHFPQGGILLMTSMEDRNWCLNAYAIENHLFSYWELEEIEKAVLPRLSSGDYYQAFSEYLSLAQSYGTTEDEDVETTGRGIGSVVLVSLGIGLGAAAVTLLIMRQGMNTKRRQRSAADYMAADGFRIGLRQDIFLYSQVHRTRRQQNTPGSSSAGSHRTRSGKF